MFYVSHIRANMILVLLQPRALSHFISSCFSMFVYPYLTCTLGIFLRAATIFSMSIDFCYRVSIQMAAYVFEYSTMIRLRSSKEMNRTQNAMVTKKNKKNQPTNRSTDRTEPNIYRTDSLYMIAV